jgi:transposase-like protein
MGRTRKRQTYTADEKARWALEVLREEKLLSELSSESGIHANVLRQWRDTLREQAREVFSGDKPALRALKEEHEREKRELYAEIGQLTTQLNWLIKKSGLDPAS